MLTVQVNGSLASGEASCKEVPFVQRGRHVTIRRQNLTRSIDAEFDGVVAPALKPEKEKRFTFN